MQKTVHDLLFLSIPHHQSPSLFSTFTTSLEGEVSFMLCRYMAERKIGEMSLVELPVVTVGAITLPLPKDSRLFQGNLGGGMKRHEETRGV